MALAVVEGWAILNLMRRQGRLLLRLEALEAGKAAASSAQTAAGIGGAPAGLPVGAAAPDFELATATGQTRSLRGRCGPPTPLERLNGEIKRRTNVVGIFPNDAAVARVVTAVVLEAHDEWAVAERYLSEKSMAKLYADPAESIPKELPLAVTA